MSALRAIETEYSGRRFRSRIEARWAVFFDALEIGWEYEAEGYHFGDIDYLPDFWLSQPRWYFEVKGAEPTPLEHLKARLLSQYSNRPVLMHAGDIVDPVLWRGGNLERRYMAEAQRVSSFDGPKLHVFDGHECIPAYHWNDCRHCGGARADGCRLLVALTGFPFPECSQVGYLPQSQFIRDAFRAANGARFEHGAKGAA